MGNVCAQDLMDGFPLLTVNPVECDRGFFESSENKRAF